MVAPMRREFSAGGVLVRRLEGRLVVAAIRPAGKPAGGWALPKGLVGPGEGPGGAARRGGAGERVFKVVSFYLVRYSGGRLGELPEAHRHEVAEARWLPLEDASRLLAY